MSAYRCHCGAHIGRFDRECLACMVHRGLGYRVDRHAVLPRSHTPLVLSPEGEDVEDCGCDGKCENCGCDKGTKD